MSYYVKVDTEKRTLTIDDSIKPNSRDQFLIDNYLKVGYTLRFKSDKRIAKAKERQANNLTIKEIEELIKDRKDLQKAFKAKKEGKGQGHGAFAAKAWFNKEIMENDEQFKGKTVDELREELEAKAEAEEKKKLSK